MTGVQTFALPICILGAKEVRGPITGVPAVYEVNGRESVGVCVGAPTPGRGETATPQSAGEYVVFEIGRASCRERVL